MGDTYDDLDRDIYTTKRLLLFIGKYLFNRYFRKYILIKSVKKLQYFIGKNYKSLVCFNENPFLLKDQ